MKHSSLIFYLLFFIFQPGVAGVKNIERVIPRYGQQGTTVEVEIQGVSLENPRELIFFKPGIRAFDFKKTEKQPPRSGFAHGGYLDSSITCKFEIASDCEPGQYPFRLLTATELTHLATFHVSPFPTIFETEEKKDSFEKAMPVVAPVTINATLGRDLADFYRVPVKAGQNLAVEVDSIRIADVHYGDSEYDLAVRVLDAEGREIAANDDNSLHTQDPVLSTKIEKTGDVFVVVERSVGQIQRTTYVVHIGTNRRPLVAFPPGAQAGTEQSFRLIGDASGEYETTLKAPQKPGNFEYFGGAASPVTLRSSPFPNVVESHGNESTPVPQMPVALNGIIDQLGDVDQFRLRVKKDEALHLRVFASALGSPIDVVLRIIDPQGTVELEADDATLLDRDVFGTSYRGGGGRRETIDPSVIWTPKLDGEYVIEISDSSGAAGPAGVYRVEIEPPRTVVQSVLWSMSFDWAESTRVTGLVVPQGGRHVVNVSFPLGQFKAPQGEFDLLAEGLPEGVRFSAPRIKPGVTLWPVSFEAEPGVKPGCALIRLVAKPLDTALMLESRSQENIPFLNHSGGGALHFVQVDQFALGVTDPVPFTIDIKAPQAALVRGGELAIPVKIQRRAGFAGPVEYWVRYVDKAVDPQPPTTIPPGETEGILRISASPKAPLGQYPLAVMARSLDNEIPNSSGAGDLRASSEIVMFSLAEPYMELTTQPENIRRGERKKWSWTVKHQTPFSGEARVKLLGLPKGVKLVRDDTKLTRDMAEVSFELEATGEALLGQASGLGCEITVLVEGQEVTQRSGNATLRIDPAL